MLFILLFISFVHTFYLFANVSNGYKIASPIRKPKDEYKERIKDLVLSDYSIWILF